MSQQLFSQALACHSAGQVQQAAAIYDRLLKNDPRNMSLLPLRGMAAWQLGDRPRARLIWGRVLSINPSMPEAHVGLGLVQEAEGDLSAAAQSFARAAQLNPASEDAHYNLANVLRALGRAGEAAQSYLRVLALNAGHGQALANYAGLLLRQGEAADARDWAAKAVMAAPGLAEAWAILGDAEAARGDQKAAIAAFRRAIQLKPDFAEAHYNLGNALRDDEQFDDAIACFRAAVALRPDTVGAWSNMGKLFRRNGELDAAENMYRRAAELAPDDSVHQSNLGSVLQAQGKADEALALHRQSVQGEDTGSTALYNLAICLLKNGELQEGWSLYRHRRHRQPGLARFGDIPEWDGSPPKGALLVWGEQGIGDEILYSGMVPDLLARGHDIVLDCEPRLAPIFRRSFAGAAIVERGQPFPPVAIAAQISTADLGALLRPTFSEFPRHPHYLRADAERSAALAERYRGQTGNRLVGISWGSKSNSTARGKTSRLLDWRPVLTQPGITFVNLQYGDTAEDRRAVKEALGIDILQDDEIDPLRDMDSFAAQVAAMDLVISTSNTTVHMAGAIGAPVWTMAPRGDGLLWYWFSGRDDSPFYPSMRLFRQTENYAWGPVIANVADRLKQWMAA